MARARLARRKGVPEEPVAIEPAAASQHHPGTVPAMAKRDLDKSASRFINALRRNTAGLETQRKRIVDRAANAPRLLEGTPYEVINLTGDVGSDLDYYIYELARLQDTGKSVINVFGQPQVVVDARAAG